MKYYKNTELADLYGVSEKSVRNWVQAANEGRLDLQIYTHKGKSYIANTSKNGPLIQQLVQKGRKYKNTRGYKVATPVPAFYTQYSSKHIFDIISSMDVYREIPHQYNYFGDGATYWDLYTQRLLNEGPPNSLTDSMELLDFSTPYIDHLLKNMRKINVIDVGIGNSLPVKHFLEYFKNTQKLRRYIGIDISPDMLRLADNNIRGWFGDKLHMEGHVRDINYDRFGDLLIPDTFSKDASTTANIVLFLGGTISNLRDARHPLSTIHDSMGKNDLLILTKKVDTKSSRRHFDFEIQSPNPKLDYRGKALVELLGIDHSLYTVEEFYDETRRARVRQITLKVALSLEFELSGEKRTVEFNKGESILLWQARHQNTIETLNELDDYGFEVLQATTSSDQQYLEVVCKINTD